MTILTLSASFSRFRPPPCTPNGPNCKEASPWQLAILYTSLFLNALGAGGYRPCIVAFGAEQFDETDPKEKTKTWSFFNWYYFTMGVSMLLAVTVVVYVQDNVGWGWGLGIPTFAMAVSVVTFAVGYPMYRRLEPSGSPFTRLAQVVVAAIKKRNIPMVSDPKHLYENDQMDAEISLYGRLVHTNQLGYSFHFFFFFCYLFFLLRCFCVSDFLLGILFLGTAIIK
jgi:solute carrier family 15 (peptide/histidine transporter), member 3/4